MIQSEDLKQLEEKGLSEKQLQEQLDCFRKGFPFLHIQSAASLYNGIQYVSDEQETEAVAAWEEYRKNHRVAKFVPASGAASRMFKDLYAFLNGESEIPQTLPVMNFFNNIRSFAFSKQLDKQCRKLYKNDTTRLIISGRYKDVVRALLTAEGMGYGELPKGLLHFHRVRGGIFTPVEEHLAEAALYAVDAQGQAYSHDKQDAAARQLLAHIVDAIEVEVHDEEAPQKPYRAVLDVLVGPYSPHSVPAPHQTCVALTDVGKVVEQGRHGQRHCYVEKQEGYEQFVGLADKEPQKILVWLEKES